MSTNVQGVAKEPIPAPASRATAWIVDSVALFLLSVVVLAGFGFWADWFSTIDRVLCTLGAITGLAIGLFRSVWGGQLGKLRVRLSILLWSTALIFTVLGFACSLPELNSIAFALTLAGWYGLRVLGTRISYACFVGVLFMFPYFVETISNDGGFEWLESATVETTAGLASAGGQPFAREGNTILFARGAADRFQAIGCWDSVVSLLGIALLGILAYRRNLLTTIASIAMTPIVLNNSGGRSLDWSLEIEIAVFLVCALSVVALDFLFASLFEPIPYELFNPESPFLSFGWNWVCNLPGLVLRVPKSSKIYARWRVKLKLAKKEPSLLTDYHWLRREFLFIAFSPIAFIGGAIDAARGWLYSRQWRLIWICLSSIVLPITVFVAFGSSFLGRSDTQVPLLVQESQQLCTTDELEEACFWKQEGLFSQVMGPSASGILESSNKPLSDQTKRYAELLCKRILTLQPKNQLAHYRLGMIYALSDQRDLATLEMKSLAAGTFGEFPQANQWLAKDIIIRRQAGENIEFQEIGVNVDKARSLPQPDFRLLRDYARVLEAQGETDKAIAVAKQAVASNQEVLLELSQLYARTKHPDFKSTAAQAEAFFLNKINIPTEKESDRLAVAAARVLVDRLSQAEEVLAEGLRLGVGKEKVTRQLSEVQRLIYVRSIKTDEAGETTADLAQLEKAAETDPTNPNISSEIAKMIPLGIGPTDSLKVVLRQQVEKGLTTVETHLLLGDAFFASKNVAGAQEHWRLALAKEPNNVTALNNYAYCLAVAMPPDIDKSLELLKQANGLAPSNADVLDTLGEVLMMAKRPREAVNKFEEAIKHNKKSISTQKKLVEAYRLCGLETDALKLLEHIEKMELALETGAPTEDTPPSK
jgi:tetratricopeptide (TPR) repeat protein